MHLTVFRKKVKVDILVFQETSVIAIKIFQKYGSFLTEVARSDLMLTLPLTHYHDANDS